ncbi:MAG: cytochrome-c peroxidase, partial [Saprospiraceae bacterium]
MKNNLLLPAIILFTLCWLGSCQREDQNIGSSQKPDLPGTPFDYSLHMSPVFTAFPIAIEVIDSSFIQNNFFGFGFNFRNPQITNAGATLGRVLFYDPQLSLNNSTACASCHRQELAFSDGQASSKGFAGATTPRNSMAIINTGFNNNLFWDSRESSVLGLVTRPIQNHIEMGVEEMRRLEVKLAKVDYYPALFLAAFGESRVTEDRIASALSQFVSAITTSNSRFDLEAGNNFT